MAFADLRCSVVDIVQAVGRVLRPAPGKATGTMIVPVALPAGEDDDTDLITSAFAHVWSVLRALRAHDERFAAELDAAARQHARGARTGTPGAGRIRFVLPNGLDLAAIRLRLVQAAGDGWERFYALLEDYAAATGGRMLPWHTPWKGAKLGHWAEKQRVAHRGGLLDAARACRLEQVPGWVWDRSDGHWHQALAALRTLASARGSLTQPAGAPSIYAGLKNSQNLPLGTWAALQRQRYPDGMLAPDRAHLLEQLPGWRWDGGLPSGDVAMIQALRVYCEFEHTPEVPEAHIESGLPLGRWVQAVRRRKLTGRLHPALAEEIAAATPRGPKGCPIFRWQTAETRWRLGYSALRAYARREGRATPPGSHIEQLPDTTVRLGAWAALQRHRYRRGALAAHHIRWLEALPGWRWEVPLARKQYGEPVDLGGHRHGTAKGVAAGCPCPPCLDLAREYGRRHLACRREIPGGVRATRARRRIAQLEAAGAAETAIAAVSGVPLGVIRNVASGAWQTIKPEHDARIRATTRQMCAAVPTRTGTRGRTVSAGNERISSAPTPGAARRPGQPRLRPRVGRPRARL